MSTRSIALAALLAAAPLAASAGPFDSLEKAAKKGAKAVGEEAKYGKVKPSDLSPSLSALDADKTLNPFLSAAAGDGKPMAEISYVISGKKNYDEFFKSAATVSASVGMSRGLLKITKTELLRIASARGVAEASSAKNLTEVVKVIAKKKGDLKPEDLTMIKSLYGAVTGLQAIVTETPGRATKLATDGQGLSKSAPGDFSKDPLKAPAVLEGLTKSISAVTSAATDAPALATELVELATAMKEIGTGGTF